MNQFRLVFGISFWSVVVLAIVLLPIGFPQNNWVSAVRRIGEYVSAERQIVQVNFERDLYIRFGDPVFLKTEYGWKRIGQVISQQVDKNGQVVRVESVKLALFGDAPSVTSDCYVTLHETPSTFEWALNHLLPEPKRSEILDQLKSKFAEHQEEILIGLTPIVRQTVFDVGMILQEDLRQALRDRREQLAQIGARYQGTFVEKRLVPLVKEEIWPIVEARSRPLLDRVGNEIWQKASLWRFGWRLAYDKFPLTNSNLLEQEWNRFVNKDAMPIIEGHAEDFYQLAKSILREIADNPEVKAAGKEGLQQVLNDQEIQKLISDTLWQVLFENPRLNEVVRQSLTDERTVRLIRETTGKFEEKIRDIGDQVFGTFEQGITTEFAGLLRNEILRRDQRWLVLNYGELTEEDRLELANVIHGYFDPDSSNRPEFVPYRNDQ